MRVALDRPGESGAAHPSVTLAVPGRSREQLWLVPGPLTWLVPLLYMSDVLQSLLYIDGLSQKNCFVRDQSDDVSEEVYYYPFFWLVFINKNIINLHYHNVL